jgi:hypothetical protein
MEVFGTFHVNAHILIVHFKVDGLSALLGRGVYHLIKCLNLKLLSSRVMLLRCVLKLHVE